jgi:membrane dipeptidase
MSKAIYEKLVQDGTWNPRDYPPPPWFYPEGIEMPEKLPNLTTGLLKRGYSEENVKMILALNLIRIFKEVWQ